MSRDRQREELRARVEAVATLASDPARLGDELEQLCHNRQTAELVGPLFPAIAADAVAAWVESMAARPDLVLSPFVTNLPEARASSVRAAAIARVLRGPLYDALHCLPACWNDPAIAGRARQLFWEAGARALVLPALGAWAWSHESAIEDAILSRAAGPVGDRVLAARTLSVLADGFVEEAAPGKLRALLAAIRSLLSHPEPLVWAPAARALGRLAHGSYSARRWMRRTLGAGSKRERRRIAAAVASVPLLAQWSTWHEDIAPWFADQQDPWQLAAFAIGTPHLAREQPDVWQSLCDTAVATKNLELVWSLADGLATLQRHAGGGSRELRAVRALHDKLTATPQTGVHETARRLEALAELDRARGGVPQIVTCLDRYDQALQASIDDPAAPPVALPSPRQMFDDAVAALASSTDTETRAWALLEIRGASKAHALQLPELVLGERTRIADTEHLFSTCEKLLGSSTEYATRSVVVSVLCDLVAAHDRQHRHGQAAARALKAIASSRWIAEVMQPSNEKSRESIRRSRKQFEDLFAVCLASYEVHQPTDGEVAPVLAAWWTLCAGTARVLGPLARDRQAAGALTERIEDLERVLEIAATSTAVATWSGMLREALVALDVEKTTIFDVVNRLIEALENAEESPLDHDHAVEQVAMLAAASDAVLSIGFDLDEAFVVGTRFETAQADTRRLRATSNAPWEQLVPALRRIVEPVARRLVRQAKDTAPFRPEPGVTLGGFKLISKLGDGGMGQVWKARDGNRYVALKFPQQQVAPKDALVLEQSLLAEARTLESLCFACVATLIHADVDRGVPYLAIELIRGRTMEQHFLQDPKADARGTHEPIVVAAMLDVLIGLDNLHRHGFVHRDLKPANIMLRMRGKDGDPLLKIDEDPHGDEIDEAVLVDFGVAHAFDVEGDGCTLGYAAPELFSRHCIGPEADLYSLGATLYHLFTGETLLGAIDTRDDAIEWHQTKDMRNDARLQKLVAEVPMPWREIIAGTCLRERAARMPLQKIRSLIKQHAVRAA